LWFVQIGGTLVVGVAGRPHEHTHILDSSGPRERVNPHTVYRRRRVYCFRSSSPPQCTNLVDSRSARPRLR
jgi:hypothetical protein